MSFQLVSGEKKNGKLKIFDREGTGIRVKCEENLGSISFPS